MKQPNTRTLAIVVVVVLLAALGAALCIRATRSGSAETDSGSTTAQRPTTRRPLNGPGGRDAASALSPEERTALVEERAKMMERFENMSEEEKEKFRAEVRKKFAAKRQESAVRNISEEERARLEAERIKMRERWENMSEEERQAYRAKMRARFGERQPLSEEQGDKPDAERSEND
jgi:hypothetical protein